MRFIVKRKEIWIQEIAVDADTEEEARKKAERDDGTMDTDPQFREFFRPDKWEVKK
jgi:hypothetical protein